MIENLEQAIEFLQRTEGTLRFSRGIMPETTKIEVAARNYAATRVIDDNMENAANTNVVVLEILRSVNDLDRNVGG